MTFTLRLFSLLSLITIFGCPPALNGGGDAGSHDGGDEAQVADYYVCVPDSAAVASAARCLVDDSCPCGSHCELGTCKASCASVSDCAQGQACDGFGRCVTSANPVKVTAQTAKNAPRTPQPLDVTPQGAIELLAVPLQLDAQHTSGEVAFNVTGAAIDEARFNTTPGLEVQCNESDTFGSECTFEALAAGSQHSLKLRLTDTSASSTPEVTVSTRRETLSFRVVYTLAPATVTRPLEGVYRGFARPIALGSVARSTAAALPATLAEVSIPVTVTVYAESAGKRVVELTDDFGIVFPEVKTVGELLRSSNGDLQLRHQARAFVGRGAGGAADVDVSVSMESLSVEKGLSGLSIALRSRYAGAVDAENDPYVSWQVSLGWVEALAPNAVAPVAPAPYTIADVSTRATTLFSSETEVQSALGAALAGAAPQTPSNLAQAVICTPYGAQAATAFADTVGSPFSGDLACTSGQPLDFGLLKESTWQLAATLSRCIGDLRTNAAIESGTMGAGVGQGCIDGARAVTALSYAIDLDRRRGLGEIISAEANASSLAHRVLQQWLRAHVFVARQATQVDLLNDVLANESQINRGFAQLEMLELTGNGFDLLLKPRIAIGLTRMTPAVVFSPDYRPRIAPSAVLTPNTRHEQTVGLPVAMVDSVQQALGVYSALYERARYVTTAREGLETSARGFVRKSFVIVALASALNDTTRANNPTAPIWASQWVRQQGLYGIGIAGLLRSIENLRRGENPLGIDDQLDLPLYRVGDQSGSIARFSAVSDYLLGAGAAPNSSAILPTRLYAAQTALDSARTAWTQNLQQDFVQATADSASEQRIEAINRRYGEQIYSLCGDPTMSSVEVLANSASIDVDTCFIKPSCRKTVAQRRLLLSPGTIAHVLCMAAGVRERLGSAATSGLTKTFELSEVQPILNAVTTVKGHAPDGPNLRITANNGTSFAVSPALFDTDYTEPIPGVVTAEELTQLTNQCGVISAASEAARPAVAPESCVFNGECPGSYSCLANVCKPTGDTANQVACYTGAMGELTVSIRSAAKDVEIARSELAELSEAYNIQMQKCIITELGGDLQVAALSSHNSTMTKFAATKLAADIAGNLAEGLANCADVVASDNKFGIAGGIACGAYVTAGVADSLSDGMEYAMGDAERSHALTMKKIETNTENQACTKEAEMSLVGAKTAVLRIERASLEVGKNLVALENRKVDVAGLIFEGKEALQSEIDRTVPTLALEFWLNEKVEIYDTAFRAARRALYLGVLAVEYEYQLSTIERQNVLAATRVAELQGVLERLRNLVATGTVKGRVPADLHSVVSLRGNLLQLASQETLPTGWHSLTEAQRFQMLLMSPRYAVYDELGQYQGQQIPFAVAPLASFKLGDPGGVPLLASGDCAERVWSVNAALQGDEPVQGDATRARVTLKKRNRFFSQWCSPAPSGSAEYQVSATRPSRNLFLDPFSEYVPGSASNSGTGTIESENEADAFASARLQPVLNVSRGDFESDQYFNGASRELAGRGLYGDYALFFPVDALARGGGDGLKLERLTDVLLRFDYVSVAQK